MGLSADGAGRGYTNEQKKLFHSQLDAITQKQQPKSNVGHMQYGGLAFATQGGTTASGATQARPYSILNDPPDARSAPQRALALSVSNPLPNKGMGKYDPYRQEQLQYQIE